MTLSYCTCFNWCCWAYTIHTTHTCTTQIYNQQFHCPSTPPTVELWNWIIPHKSKSNHSLKTHKVSYYLRISHILFTHSYSTRNILPQQLHNRSDLLRSRGHWSLFLFVVNFSILLPVVVKAACQFSHTNISRLGFLNPLGCGFAFGLVCEWNCGIDWNKIYNLRLHRRDYTELTTDK